MYTHNLPTIYGRYIGLLTELNEPESNIKYETSISKLKSLFFELDNYGILKCEEKELKKIDKKDIIRYKKSI